jgi:hypothetical protein
MAATARKAHKAVVREKPRQAATRALKGNRTSKEGDYGLTATFSSGEKWYVHVLPEQPVESQEPAVSEVVLATIRESAAKAGAKPVVAVVAPGGVAYYEVSASGTTYHAIAPRDTAGQHLDAE